MPTSQLRQWLDTDSLITAASKARVTAGERGSKRLKTKKTSSLQKRVLSMHIIIMCVWLWRELI